MTVPGTVGVRFANGDTSWCLVDSARIHEVLHFDGFYAFDEAAFRRHVAGLAQTRSIGTADAAAPMGPGLVVVDFQQQQIFLHLEGADPLRLFASRGAKSSFVAYAAECGRARLVVDGSADVALSRQDMSAAQVLLARPDNAKRVAGHGRVAWMIGDIVIDTDPWRCRSFAHTKSGYEALLVSLVAAGIGVDRNADAWISWQEDLAEAA